MMTKGKDVLVIIILNKRTAHDAWSLNESDDGSKYGESEKVGASDGAARLGFARPQKSNVRYANDRAIENSADGASSANHVTRAGTALRGASPHDAIQKINFINRVTGDDQLPTGYIYRRISCKSMAITH